MELCDVILQTNRVRCTLNMEILDLLNEESVSGACSGRASLINSTRSPTAKFEKVRKYDSNFFSFTNIYIYGHHDRSPYPARAARAWYILLTLLTWHVYIRECGTLVITFINITNPLNMACIYQRV